MAKFRSKPVVIEAQQFHEDQGPYPKGVTMDKGFTKSEFEAYLWTSRGPLHISDGDWVITDTDGDRYPCGPEFFKAAYEPITGDAPL